MLGCKATLFRHNLIQLHIQPFSNICHICREDLICTFHKCKLFMSEPTYSPFFFYTKGHKAEETKSKVCPYASIIFVLQHGLCVLSCNELYHLEVAGCCFSSKQGTLNLIPSGLWIFVHTHNHYFFFLRIMWWEIIELIIIHVIFSGHILLNLKLMIFLCISGNTSKNFALLSAQYMQRSLM